MDCYDFQIQLCVHNGENEVTPFAGSLIDGQWVDRDLTECEQSLFASLDISDLRVAVRNHFSHDPCLFQDSDPQNIPEGTYVIPADALFLSGWWDTDDLDRENQAATLQGFPRVWELLRYLFNQKVRESLFDPSYHVLLKDHLETRAASFQTWRCRLWLGFCFLVRTLGLVAQCAWTEWRVAVVGFAIAIGPKWLAELLRGFYQD